ncbi:MAG: 50S ribosomal protein L4 [Candidatus Kerfeldbacteria bacterium]|nr:50S ribosomal protein L4 [Candidatus Kerfeldbacteria bacterium]
MPKLKVYDTSGQVMQEQEVSAAVFAVPMKTTVVHQVVVAQQANSRPVLAHTKTRAEVRGGGKKPWKQKHTGRARVGSSRSPIWRGGGVTFGPRNDRNFSLRVNKKMKMVALRMVLSDKVAHDHFIILENFNSSDGKTKTLRDQLAKLPSKAGSTILSMAKKEPKVVRAAQNLPRVGVIAADSLNVVDLLKYDYVIVDRAAIAVIEHTYGNS